VARGDHNLRGEVKDRMTWVTPKDSREIQNKIVSVLRTLLDDPYCQVKGAGARGAEYFIYGDDFKAIGNPPQIHVDMTNFDPVRITSQSKTDYLEEERHDFMIYYYNQLAHKYTFSDNGLELADVAQCRKYLQYIRDTLKANMAEFNEYFHKHAFGVVPKPVRDSKTGWFVSMLPFTVFTYRR